MKKLFVLFFVILLSGCSFESTPPTDIENKPNVEETKLENPFVTGLPDWDLEPLYEPIKRGNQQ